MAPVMTFFSTTPATPLREDAAPVPTPAAPTYGYSASSPIASSSSESQSSFEPEPFFFFPEPSSIPRLPNLRMLSPNASSVPATFPRWFTDVNTARHCDMASPLTCPMTCRAISDRFNRTRWRTKAPTATGSLSRFKNAKTEAAAGPTVLGLDRGAGLNVRRTPRDERRRSPRAMDGSLTAAFRPSSPVVSSVSAEAVFVPEATVELPESFPANAFNLHTRGSYTRRCRPPGVALTHRPGCRASLSSRGGADVSTRSSSAPLLGLWYRSTGYA